jgi:predicted outer membrane repeat protein
VQPKSRRGNCGQQAGSILQQSVVDAWEGPGSRAAAAASLLALGFAAPAQAVNFAVTNINDAGAGSLRQAIIDANGAAGADTITFNPGVSGTITLTTGQLSITDSVTITGPGAANLAVSGNNASRVFEINNGSANLDVTIAGLTVADGNAPSGAGIINVDENLTLDGVRITNCTATGDGGGLWADGFNMNLTIRNTTISGNTSGDDGGGIYVEDTGGLLLIENTVISGNNAAGHGGGIYFYDPDADITIDSSIISGNIAGGSGGGIYMYSPDAGTFTMRNTTVSGNSAARGGGIYFYDMDHQAFIENSTISGNTATSGNGGGLAAYSVLLDLVNTTITNNQATEGSGVFVENSSLGLDINNSIIAGNAGGSDLAIGGGAGGVSVPMSNKPAKPAKTKVEPGKDSGVAQPQATGGQVNAANSLIQSSSGVVYTTNSNNIFGQAAGLGVLADNGGPVVGAPGFASAMLTHLPDGASPVVDAGDNTLVPASANDQRGAGHPRIVGGTVDMGAVEWAAAQPAQPAQPHDVPALGAPALAGLSALVALFGWRSRRRIH